MSCKTAYTGALITYNTHNPVLSSFMTYYLVCNKSNKTGVTSGAGIAYPSGAPEFTPRFQWGSCFLLSALQIFACPFFLFILAIVLSVFIRFTVSDYSFGIINHFISRNHI